MKRAKIRAWHKKEKCMFFKDVFSRFWHKQGEMWNIAKLRTIDRREFEEVMLHFGRWDKRGRDIYEEDIIKHNNCIFILKWDDCHACFYRETLTKRILRYSIKSGGHKEDRYAVYDLRTHQSEAEWEIIGNTWENPELSEENHE